MPFTADEQQIIDRLHRLHRDTEASILRQIADATTSPNARARLRALLPEVNRAIAALTESTRTWVATETPAAYAAGATRAAAGTVFSWTNVHREAVEALARTTWDDVAAHLQGVNTSTQRAIRTLLDDNVRRQILEGVAGPRASRQLGAVMQDDLGAMTVTYSNGARHSVADYADTLARTSTAITRNTGALAQTRADGFGYVELFDGADCGVSSHNDPRKANGLVVTVEEAEQHPISHPRCARSVASAPGVTNAEEAEEARRYTAEEQQQMAAEERARAETRLVDGRPRGVLSVANVGRTARTPRVARTPRG